MYRLMRLHIDIERPVHHCLARSISNIAAVSESVIEDPNVSSSRRSRAKTFLRLIMAYVLFRITGTPIYEHS